MADYLLVDAPQAIDLTKGKVNSLLRSLQESRRSITSGAFLTKANVVPGTLQLVGKVKFCFGSHQFPDTMVARAIVTMNVRQTVAPAPNLPGQKPQGPVQIVVKSVNVPELVFNFNENHQVFFLVPRDSTLERPDPGYHLYTFLTLRNQPGGTTLQHQVIPVTFPSNKDTDVVVEVMRGHINKHNEVKDKMANAFRHIPKMGLKYLDFKSAVSEDISSPIVKKSGTSTMSDNKSTISKKPRIPRKVGPEVKTPNSKGKRTVTEESVETPITDKMRKKKKASIIPEGWKCEICGVTTTVMRRRGPSGLNCACNSCGQAWAQANRARSSSEVTKQETA